MRLWDLEQVKILSVATAHDRQRATTSTQDCHLLQVMKNDRT